jgi:hypothetical protein
MTSSSAERVARMRQKKTKIEAHLDELDLKVLEECRRMCGDLPDATIVRRALLAYQRELMRDSIRSSAGE